MKRIIVLSFVIAFSAAVNAQQPKMPRSLLKKLEQAQAFGQYEREIALFAKGNTDEIKQAVEALGGTSLFVAGDISALRIPVSKVALLAESPAISWLEDNSLQLQPLNDVAIIHNRVQEVHSGANLPQGYDGRGVIMGIIDEGIDISHPDFRDLQNRTRIKYIWDQTLCFSNCQNAPQPYNYGVEFRGANMIDTASTHKDNLNTGHGTHVAGSACGNGNTLNNYKGMAPNSDIIIVKMNLNQSDNDFLTSIVHAIQYVFSKADSLGMPAVINISLGTYYGSHDGRDIQSQAIANIINAKPGRVVVAAAGNAGAGAIHTGYSVGTDTSFTWIHNTTTFSFIEIWGDPGSFDNVSLAVGIDQIKPSYKYAGGSPFRTVSQLMSKNFVDTIYSQTGRQGTIATETEFIQGSYRVRIFINSDSSTADNSRDFLYRWRLMSKSADGGRLDAWCFNYVFDGLPDAATFPSIVQYKKPDYFQNIVSSFQCLDQVITVGSYDNRNHYSNANLQQTVDTNIHPGHLSGFSSHGPTRDGRIKPDITAPGAWILSTGPLSILTILANVDPLRIAAGSKHFRSNGTSMASPMVAGIAALYLQAHPDATWLEVKNALTRCATRDEFTGSDLPNQLWGFGKANAYAMLKGCDIGIDEQGFDAVQLWCYPNPAQEHALINYDLRDLKYNHAEIQIMNTLGSLIEKHTLTDRQNSLLIRNQELGSGIYFYSLVIDGRIVKTKKLVMM